MANNDRKGLKKISQHYVQNAFHRVQFCDRVHGIYSATPPEILHAILKGLHDYGLGGLMDHLTDTYKKELDIIIQEFSVFCAHQSARNLPRTKFAHGITNLSKINAEEKSGILLLCVFALACAKGKKMIRRTKRNPQTYTSFRKLFQRLLCYEQWL